MISIDFNELYALHANRLRRSILRIVRQQDQAEDILQEVYIRAWAKSRDLSEIRNPANWLTKIAINLSLNHLRSVNRRRELTLGEGAVGEDNYAAQKALTDFSTPGPESELIRNSRVEVLRRLIADLPAEKREVLELVDQEDFSIRETSDRLGIPDGTVKSRLHYGRRILTERIKELLDE